MQQEVLVRVVTLKSSQSIQCRQIETIEIKDVQTMSGCFDRRVTELQVYQTYNIIQYYRHTGCFIIPVQIHQKNLSRSTSIFSYYSSISKSMENCRSGFGLN